jgi:hypothetical protein
MAQTQPKIWFWQFFRDKKLEIFVDKVFNLSRTNQCSWTRFSMTIMGMDITLTQKQTPSLLANSIKRKSQTK